ncbi:zinc finger protein 676-like [Belonocnema kinseyi]|uniref:zinc finger protein 676-like n=1 Tax=Belonocnema kinseyi TaxID=2817044 RepID=UPI00143D215E|nr:zinc finger protein 676-like [Belonocnema kinseyi]
MQKRMLRYLIYCHIKREPNESTGREVGASYTNTTTRISTDKKFDSKTLIEYHNDVTLEIKEEIIQDPKRILVQKSNKTSKSIHNCDKCSRSYNWMTNLNRHKRLHHMAVNPKFTCDCCGYETNRQNNLIKHINSSHSHKTRTRHKCDKCSRSYRYSNTLNRHKRLEHATTRPQFTCDFCGYQTNVKYSLAKHITSRHSQTLKSRHKCDKCSRSYAWLSHLNRHKRVEHVASKPKSTLLQN